jgi:hypothetical protein
MRSIGLGNTILLVLIMVSICGCTAVDPNKFATVQDTVAVNATSAVNVTPAPTPTPAKPVVTPSNIVPTIITPNLTIVPTTSPTPTPKPTRAPRLRDVPTPSPTMNLTEPYLEYSDTDFTVEYPSNWTVEKTLVSPTHNQLNRRMEFTGDARNVYFNSGNASVGFVVTTTDLLVGGSEVLQPDFSLAADTINSQFNDASGTNVISNFVIKYTALYKVPMIQFDVSLPVSSTSYPLSYTERDFVSYSHYYSMRFTNRGSIDDYTDIKKHIFDTMKMEEIVKV